MGDKNICKLVENQQGAINLRPFLDGLCSNILLTFNVTNPISQMVFTGNLHLN